MRGFGKLFNTFLAALTISTVLLGTSAAFSQVREAKNVSEALNLGSATPLPRYQIFDIGVVQNGDTASQGFGVSTGGVAVGRSVRNGGAQAFTWTRNGGIVGLPNLSGRAFCVSNGANNNGAVAGTCASTLFGSSRLPVIWQNGNVAQLPLPSGETLGDANDINASGIAVGSVNSGSLQRGVVYNGANAAVITQTTANGSFFLTAFGINDSGRVVGQGIDPTNAARNVGIVYDIGSGTAFEVGALSGANGALAFGVGNAGHVVGSSMLNQGSGLPFIWSQSGGMTEIPLPTGTTQGSARAVNSSGWAVGNASSAFSIPFLYTGNATYRLADLIPSGSGWDLSMNTSSSALGISDSNVIVGTGVLNGQVHAYAMIPVSRIPFDFFGSGRTSFATVGLQNNNFLWWLANNGGSGESNVVWGLNTDLIKPADFDGDGRTDVAVYRGGSWYWLNSSNNSFNAAQFGIAGDLPVPFDYSGDGKAELAVYRSGIWYQLNLANNQIQAVQFGIAIDKPVPADYDGDGKIDIAVYRDGVWYWQRSSDNGFRAFQFGIASDKPITGDFDGDGRADQAVYRNGSWYIQRSSDGFLAAQFGLAADIPLVGDYNGDGRSDIAVYRPSNSTFYWLNSPTFTAFAFKQHGLPNDVPVAVP